MNVIGFTQRGAIEAEVDGVLWVIPDDPANRHRQMIMEWEAKGNTIPAYEPPEQILEQDTRSPTEKLVQFLQANPDVAVLIKEGTMNDKDHRTT